MNNLERYSNLSDDDLRSLNDICESFERDLQQGVASIEDRFASANDRIADCLFPELLTIELESKSIADADEVLEAYLQRFPSREAEVREIFEEFVEASSKVQTLAASGTDAGTNEQASRFTSGTVISDRYTLKKKIGEGGMGEVWIANQSQPIARQVAIKLIKTGMDSRAVIARFELERQSLAMMDHPNIAKVYDAGVTPQGLPFFAMELVDGLPLDKYCDGGMLSPADRLQLFVPICQAVQHAHQKGIVHRDLKPGNILVVTIDGKAVPKVIDFGVAKATFDNPTESSLATKFGTVVGTLAYMSPEQAGMTDLDIDTRSDIYSLGVVLYELLTGLRPIDTPKLQSAGIAEMVRVIQEEEPSRPSTKLSSHASLPSAASARNIEPKKLTSMLRGELDWIAMRCLEKDRDRRYESSSALARDIQRYLTNEPVEARPPSTTYLFTKFLKRNKGAVVAVTAVFFALIAGIAGTSVGLYRAEQAREDAVIAQNAEAERAEGERLAKLDAEQQATLAMKSAAQEKIANSKAQKRLSQVEKSNEILSDIFKSLNPRVIAESEEPLQVILVGKVIDAVHQLDGDAIGDSTLVARMQTDLGKSLLALSAPEEATAIFQKSYDGLKSALGADHPESLATLFDLAEAHRNSGRNKVSMPMYKEAYDGLKSQPDTEIELMATVQAGLANAYSEAGDYLKAVSLHEDAVELKRKKLGEDHPETQWQILMLTEVYTEAGQPLKALGLLRKCFESLESSRGLDHPDTLTVMTKLAKAYNSVGNTTKSLRLYKRAFEATKTTLGKDHEMTLSAMGGLALLQKDLGQTDKAISILKERQERAQAKLGANHPEALNALSDLASGYLANHDYELALSCNKQVHEAAKKKNGPDHYNTIVSLNNVAKAYQSNGDLELARPVYEEALAAMKKNLPTNHPMTLVCLGNLATIYQDLGEFEPALQLFEQALSIQTDTLGEDHPDTLRTMNNLAAGYWSNKRLDKSVPFFRKLVSKTTKLFGRDHPNTQMTVMNLGVNLKDSDKSEDALPFLKEAYAAGADSPGLRIMAGMQLLDAYAKLDRKSDVVEFAEEYVATVRESQRKGSSKLAFILCNVGAILNDANAFSEAKELLTEASATFEKKNDKYWKKFYAMSLLGESLLGQNQIDDAEPKLVEGYEGMKKLTKTIPSANRRFIAESLSSLIKLYELNGDSAKATARREELQSMAIPARSKSE